MSDDRLGPLRRPIGAVAVPAIDVADRPQGPATERLRRVAEAADRVVSDSA